MDAPMQVEIVDPPSNFKSVVWKHFGFLPGDKNTTVCRICYEKFSYKSGSTTAMGAHLKRKHNVENDKPVKTAKPETKTNDQIGNLKSSRKSGQLKIQDAVKLPANSMRAKAISNAIGVFIAKDMRPFSVIENVGFKHLLRILEPRYDIPSRTHFAETVIPKLYREVKNVVVEQLKEATFISLTSDSWTSRATESYNTITVQFLHEWTLKSYVLQTRIMTESHTSDNISEFLNDAVDEWKLKRFGENPILTTDNARNIVNAAKSSNMWHIGCVAHTINLATQKGLKVTRLDRLLGRIRRVVNFFHRSTTAAAILKSKQVLLELPEHKLVHDVPTRWNSSYDMLQRFLEQQPAIEATLFSKDIRQNAKDVYTLSPDDIRTGEKVMAILEPIKKITVMLCDEKTPTVSMIHPLKEQMLNGLLSAENNTDDDIVEAVKAAIRNDLEPRYTEPQVLNFLLESSFLDPRFKSMPYVDDAKRMEISTSVILKAASLQEKMTDCYKVKVEKEMEPEPAQPTTPALPSLPVPANVQPNSDDTGPESKKRKSAMHDFFGDVFLTKVEPATTTALHENSEKEVNKYKQETLIDLDSNPLLWWKINEFNYPLLANLAKKFLSAPATSVASERVFSTAGDIVTAQRSQLSPESVDILIFLAKNLRA